MKIFDCFMYFDEDIVLDVRLNYLDKYVDQFIIIESEYNHKGEKRTPLFDINKFKKFENKIKYILTNDIPPGIENIKVDDNESEIYRKSIFNAWKRENLQRNQISEGLSDAQEEDWVIISDLDEIPNLSEIKLKNINDNFVFFKQDMMYYKFNLRLENHIWVGSKACKVKNLESPQWIRDIKDKKYQWWRIDAYFSKKKYHNIRFIENGGWHFSYLMTADEISKKIESMAHTEFNKEKFKNIEKIKENINNLIDPFDRNLRLKKVKIDDNYPEYLVQNINLYKDWILN